MLVSHMITVVYSFVEGYTARYGRLNLLVNNAGLNTIGMVNPRTLDGFELAYGVNFIGPYYLTTLLLPLLRAGAPSRIVNVTCVYTCDDLLYYQIEFLYSFGLLLQFPNAPQCFLE